MAKKNIDYKKLMKDFWYGKPHGERRLGDIREDKTGLYKHREWRGVKDTMYYFLTSGCITTSTWSWTL